MIRRRKSLLTLLFILSFFLYVNWFISISNWSNGSNKHHDRPDSHENLELDMIDGDLRLLKKAGLNNNHNNNNNNKKQQIIFELFEAYEVNEKIQLTNERVKAASATNNNKNNDNEINKKGAVNQFLLISSKDSVGTGDQDNVQVISSPTAAVSVEAAEKLNRQELNFLLKLLFRNRAFVADTNLHDEIRFKDSTLSTASNLESSTVADDALGYEIATMNSIGAYFGLKEKFLPDLFLSYGILYSNVESLNNVTYYTHLLPFLI
jgi:hypothetical protein